MGKMNGGSRLRQKEVLWVKIVGGYGLRWMEVMVSDRKGFCG